MTNAPRHPSKRKTSHYKGPYDDGYEACQSFWGTEPGSLISRLSESVQSFSDYRVLDAGCGEGKNAVYLARRGAEVLAVDMSECALRNARKNWDTVAGVRFLLADIRSIRLTPNAFELVIAYGLLHCLPTKSDVFEVISKLQTATAAGGFNVVCAFNSRRQDLSAHPGFAPTLLPHGTLLDAYKDWEVPVAFDEDLWETHPHNRILHVHSMTRLIARKPQSSGTERR